MLEPVVLLVFVGAWALLGLLAFHFGHDSRDGIGRPADGPVWRRPITERLPNGRRIRPSRPALHPSAAAFAAGQRRATDHHAGQTVRHGKDGDYAMAP